MARYDWLYLLGVIDREEGLSPRSGNRRYLAGYGYQYELEQRQSQE